MKRACFVISSLKCGGAERVISELSGYFALNKKTDTHLIVLTKSDRFYDIPPEVAVHEPDFYYSDYLRPVYIFKTFWYLRKILRELLPDAVLSFQAEYNALTLLASVFLKLRVFISDRARPGKSYGPVRDLLNPVLYRSAAGIVAQTEAAKNTIYGKTCHKNIATIGNPIRAINNDNPLRENIILSVGRMIQSKGQDVLIDIFAKIGDKNWRLVFCGDGPLMPYLKKKASDLGVAGQVIFAGNRKNIDGYYSKSKIFAFTSTSEGFPTSLGEALNTPLASISFDCPAGPADLIEDGFNGFLIPMHNVDDYRIKLIRLMQDGGLRDEFEKRSKMSMEKYRVDIIAERYYNFLLGSK